MDENRYFKSGYVALVGKPNVGKSTVLNALLQMKLAIVTAKPQTTRRKILGILTGADFQIIFIDTPGIIDPAYDLQKVMMRYYADAVSDADIVCLLVDASLPVDPHLVPEELKRLTKPIILLINKIDLIPKKQLLPLIDRYRQFHAFSAIIPVSGLKNDGADQVVQKIVSLLPVHPAYYPPEYTSDQTERFFVAEIIREKIFQLYRKEIPYACHVDIEDYREQAGYKDYIRGVIVVDQASQKGILIGKGGAALKQLGESARRDIEAFLQRPVFLEIYVRVLANWRKKLSHLKNLGY